MREIANSGVDAVKRVTSCDDAFIGPTTLHDQNIRALPETGSQSQQRLVGNVGNRHGGMGFTCTSWGAKANALWAN
ncbi:hypothetical protein PsYK624_136690 [Phanerochaete sordida]|uniref:Uncharacterized protein n=1 Tax=Phanerochaete sordida TaxID=48140 RepID=A0A9P3LJJ7_9APHY|nr:hypothetical protein PsYK624_136690 [Phanerochaete sordida]